MLNILMGKGHGDEHEEHSLWEETWEIFSDPAHIISEVAWHIIIELVLIAFVYGVVIKKIILPKLRKEIHKEIDKEHGYEHSDDKNQDKE
jgi:hypothetical protein